VYQYLESERDADGPVARETLLDLWARWGAWLEKYVKNPQKAEPKKMTNDQALVVR
jgi:hypothetical protein